ncbi:MAG: polysaccharide biosynthesis protein [Candidatus Omnitrophica bacterium]|nr:polysaccharide biosynthesis protein [Candidatus Omnitrophota bacterium]
MDLHKQFPLNLAANIISFVMNVVIGIFMVPYFIRHLGAEAYGFIPLAATVTAYVGLINFGLNAATARFFTIDFQRGDIDNANKFFNTAFWTISVGCIVLLPLLSLFAYFSPHVFHIPTQLTTQVQWLFFFIFSSFLFSIFSSVFGSPLFALNRLDLQNMIDISGLGLRTALIVLLFLFFRVSLPAVGIAYLLSALGVLSLSIYLWRKKAPQLRIARSYYDKTKLRDIWSMSGWIVLDQIGSLLLLQVDLIVCNLLFGGLITGQYAAILQLNFLLRSVAGVFSGVFSPMVLISHAREDKDSIISISRRAVKFMAIGIAFPVGLLCGFAKPVLNLWLGNEYVKYVPLVWVFAAHLTINLGIQPLFAIQRALNKVRTPALVVIFIGILNVILAVVFAKFLHWGVIGIAVAGALVLTIRHAIFVPFYAAYILKIPLTTFIKPVWKGVVLTIGIMVVAVLLTQYVCLDNYGKLFVAAVGVSMTFIFFAWKFLLAKEERAMLFNMLVRFGR